MLNNSHKFCHGKVYWDIKFLVPLVHGLSVALVNCFIVLSNKTGKGF